MRDLGTLHLQSLIVHEIPVRRAGQEGPGPRLSEIECELTPELRGYFREKIITSLRTAAFGVEADPDTTSPVPALVLECIDDPSNIVGQSQTMAKHLHACQTGVNSPGLLAVAVVELENVTAVAILKLEKEAGLRVRETTVDGKFTLSLEHLRELMLTESTRVFKVGVLWLAETADPSCEGLVSDKQGGNQPTTEMAAFFLTRFLGCRLLEAPKVATKRFFEASQGFINDLDDPTQRAQYEMALLAELSNNHGMIRPRSFAQNNLRVTHRQPYLDCLAESGVAPSQFPKDTTLVNARLNRIQMSFASGVHVIAPPETFDDEIKLSRLEDGRTRVEIEDELDDIRGRN